MRISVLRSRRGQAGIAAVAVAGAAGLAIALAGHGPDHSGAVAHPRATAERPSSDAAGPTVTPPASTASRAPTSAARPHPADLLRAARNGRPAQPEPAAAGAGSPPPATPGAGGGRTAAPPPPPPAGGGPPPPGSGSGSVSTDSGAAQAVFAALNQSRQQAGLPALAWNAALQRSAHQHNLAMAAANKLAHQLPGEADLGSRISAQGLAWRWAGENIGYTTDRSVGGALSLEAAMMAEQPPEDGHRRNILSTQATAVGIDVVIDAAHGTLWLTEDFAQT